MGGKSPPCFQSPGPRGAPAGAHAASPASPSLSQAVRPAQISSPPSCLYSIPFPILLTGVSLCSQAAWRRHQIQCGASGNGQSHLQGPEPRAGHISANPHPTSEICPHCPGLSPLVQWGPQMTPRGHPAQPLPSKYIQSALVSWRPGRVSLLGSQTGHRAALGPLPCQA